MLDRARTFLVILACLGVSTLVHGQFQEPTPEELHMTTDAKAPGAAAVYLYLEERTDNSIHFHSYYARIKVLSEKGLERATVRIPYERGEFQVAAIEGRTIHPDGSVVLLKTKPADIMAYKGGGHQYNDVTFTLPAVTVGSILEYRLQLRYSEDTVWPPVWIIQQEYFVHKAHYFFNPIFSPPRDVLDSHGQIAGRLMYASRLRSGGPVAMDALQRYSLDVADVPPLPSGDYLPPLNTVRESVSFFYADALSGPEFWDREGKYWARDLDRFISPTGEGKKELRKAAAELVAPSDGDAAKASKIYAAVMKMENRDFVRGLAGAAEYSKGKGRSGKDVSGVLKAQGGTGDEIALAFVAVARAAGLRAWPMQVVNRDRALFEPTFLSTRQFDDYIAVVELDGKDVFLDPGQKMCPFGLLHWIHEGTKGFRMTAQGVTIADTPGGPAKAAETKRIASVTIGDHGAVAGDVTVKFSGLEALHWRQLALLEDAGDLEKDFNEYLESELPDGVQGKLEGFDGQGAYESELTAHVKLCGVLGAATGKRLILPAMLFETRDKHQFAQDDERPVPIDLHYATVVQDEVTFHLPAGMNIDALPTDPGVDWAGGIKLAIEVTRGAGSVTVKRTFVRSTAMMDATLYSGLRFVYQRISRADQQQIVLSRAGDVPGN